MTAYEHLYEYLCFSCWMQDRYKFTPTDGVKFREWEHDLRCVACDWLLRFNPLGRPLGTPMDEG